MKYLQLISAFLLITLVVSCSEDAPEVVNEVPTLANELQDIMLNEGFESVTVSLANTFTDPEGEPLTYDVTVDDESIITAAISGSLLTLTEEGVGTTTITIEATDSEGESISDDFIVAVNERQNNAPTVENPIQDQQYDEGFGTDELSFAGVFDDADGDQLTYEVTSSDESVVTLALQPQAKLLITEVGTGTATVTFTVNDGNGGMVSDAFEIEVIPAANNAPTVVNPIDDQSQQEGFSSYQMDISSVFEDSDDDELTYAVSSSDENVVTVSIDQNALLISEEGLGAAEITLTATDPENEMATDVFTFTVTEASTGTEVSISFGTPSGNSLSISAFTTNSSYDGYVILISDDDSFNSLTNGANVLASPHYIGFGDQAIYSGTISAAIDIELLEDQKTYYFKAVPYTGDFVFDNSQASASSTTISCSIESETENQVCFKIGTDTRTVTANQYPSHDTGNFPNADPTAIQVTRILNLTPEEATELTYVYNETGPPTPSNRNFWQFGIAINGVEFHPMGLKPWTVPDGNDNAGEENWEWQAKVTEAGETHVDDYGAHVTSQGNYHYHGEITGLADEDGSRHSLLYGFAGDGYPIYYKYGYTSASDPTSSIKELKSSYQLKSGNRSGDGTAGVDYPDGAYDGTYIQDYEFIEGLGDLDECNGRTGVTPEYPEGTYYYVITADFPVTPNCFYGTPDEDWLIGQ